MHVQAAIIGCFSIGRLCAPTASMLSSARTQGAIEWVAMLAVGTLPWLSVIPSPPNMSLYNEAVAWVGWATLALLVLNRAGSALRIPRTIWPVLASVALLASAAVVDVLVGRVLYPGIAVTFLGYLAGASLAAIVGVSQGQRALEAEATLDHLACAWLLGALISAVICGLQYTQVAGDMPPIAGAIPWIADVATPGRMYANLRQPNHLATVLCIAQVATCWLHARGRIRFWVAFAASTALALALAMTGSRTGVLSAVLTGAFLALAVPRSSVKALAMSHIFAIAVMWAVLTLVAKAGLYPFFGYERLSEMQTNATGARWPVWVDTVQMILAYPLAGTGLGRYSFHYMFGAWSYPADLPFFHAHNIVLHLAAEHGLIVCAAVLVPIGWVVWRAVRREPGKPLVWMPVAALLPIFVHSQFEFPLWYSYFLFPAAYCLGLLATGDPSEPSIKATPRSLRLAAYAVMLAPFAGAVSTIAGQDMYTPQSRPIAVRIQEAQSAFLFRHQADNALMTLGDPDLTYNWGAEPVYRALLQTLPNTYLMREYTLFLAKAGYPEAAARLVHQIRWLSPGEYASMVKRLERLAESDPAAFQSLLQLSLRPAPPSIPISFWSTPLQRPDAAAPSRP